MSAIEGVVAYQGWSLRGVPLYSKFEEGYLCANCYKDIEKLYKLQLEISTLKETVATKVSEGIHQFAAVPSLINIIMATLQVQANAPSYPLHVENQWQQSVAKGFSESSWKCTKISFPSTNAFNIHFCSGFRSEYSRLAAAFNIISLTPMPVAIFTTALIQYTTVIYIIITVLLRY